MLLQFKRGRLQQVTISRQDTVSLVVIQAIVLDILNIACGSDNPVDYDTAFIRCLVPT